MSGEVRTIGDCTLYLGDCREVLPTLEPVDVVVTDPVWPNMPAGLFRLDTSPAHLMQEALASVTATRLAVVLGCQSDPRFLQAIPARWPFVCCQVLEYALPAHVGRVLCGMEMVYGFGSPIRSTPGRRVIPGRSAKAQPHRAGQTHPCPRAIEHMQYVVYWWSDPGETVLDPFAGSGTTAVACVNLGRRFIGIEIDPDFFAGACQRIEDAYRQMNLFMPESGEEQLRLYASRSRKRSA